ncbi:MAG: globin [Sphingobium sp.]|nr:MAG: globin [Sphingobium sp.]
MNAAAPPSPYAILGDAAIRRLVDRFYDIIEADPDFARLRAMHGADLTPVRHGLHRFLAGWLGGPRDWFDRGQCIMSIHRMFAIDAGLADQWSRAMARAIADEAALHGPLGTQLTDALRHMAHAMITAAKMA